ncbi:MAG: AzlD domain-containing protein [Erysipelotrichaceae bacterium]
MNNAYVYIFIMFIVTYIIRVLPLTIMRKKIKNKIIQSFLYYVPYVTLSIMTFPTMMYATNSLVAGVSAFVLGLFIAWFDGSLFKVAISCSIVVFLIELFI